VSREKINFRKTGLSFVIAFLVFGLTYLKSFIDAQGVFNIFLFLAKDLKFMLTHNSAGSVGGSILLFVTGFFTPWWEPGVLRAGDWSFLWPVGLAVGVIRGFREKIKGNKLFFYLLPFTFLLLTSTQVPFTRYFIIILPFVYLNLANALLLLFKQK
jgi:hypothetical protein